MPGNIITLNHPLTDFAYVDMYASLSGNVQIYTFDAGRTYFEVKTFNTQNNTTGISIGFTEGRLDRISDTTLTLNDNSWVLWQWSGIAADNAKKSQSADTFYVYKIVGRKY